MIPVIGLGQISIFDTGELGSFYPGKIFVSQLAGRMFGNDHFLNVKYDPDTNIITFEMSGNKGIDYTELEKIKEQLIKKKIRFEIHVKEYMECDGTGFYYSTQEIPNLERKQQ